MSQGTWFVIHMLQLAESLQVNTVGSNKAVLRKKQATSPTK
jgi:hypothetical protein